MRKLIIIAVLFLNFALYAQTWIDPTYGSTRITTENIIGCEDSIYITSSAGDSTYIVSSGDSLYFIAGNLYMSGSLSATGFSVDSLLGNSIADSVNVLYFFTTTNASIGTLKVSVFDTLNSYPDTTVTNSILDSLASYPDTTTTNSIWDSLGAYPDTTITNAIRDSLASYSDSTVTNAISDSLCAYSDSTAINAILDTYILSVYDSITTGAADSVVIFWTVGKPDTVTDVR